MMTPLILLSVPSYSYLADAKSSVESTTSNFRANSRSYCYAAFFVPVFFAGIGKPSLWVLHVADSVQTGLDRYLGTGKPVSGCGGHVHYPPYSTTTDVEGYKNNLSTEVFVMSKKKWVFTPEECFVLDRSVDFSQFSDPLATVFSRSLSVLAMLQANGHDLNEGFTLCHKDVMNVLWSLQMMLEQGEYVLKGCRGAYHG